MLITRLHPRPASTVLCIFTLMFFMFPPFVSAQEPEEPTPVTAPSTSPEGPDTERVRVDWLEEMKEGGFTMLALLGLSVALVTLILERNLGLRENNFFPEPLRKQGDKLLLSGDLEGLAALSKKHPSLLASVFLVLCYGEEDESADDTFERASDTAARLMDEQDNKLMSFALIAGLAPLLGLLGTMIGMIESFKLVEVFGDEGGASMLAGSISKALITTAVGLIIAMPALLAHHVFTRKTQRLQVRVEEVLESLQSSWRKLSVRSTSSK
ncbi:MAG: MotA/TolQ/ExbB proton channel family protein [Kiritimatiellia bacterium]